MNKRLKKLTSVGLAAALSLGFFVSTHPASADDTGFTLTFTADEGHIMEVVTDHLRIDGQFVDAKRGETTVGTVACADTQNCTITFSEAGDVTLNFNTADAYSLFYDGSSVIPDTTVFNSNSQIRVQDSAHSDPERPFSGTAWFVWDCDGNLCKSEITGINRATEIENGMIAYDTRYIPASEVSDNGRTVNIKELNESGHYYWVWADGDNSQGTPAISTIPADKDTWAKFSTWFNDNFEGEGHYDALRDFAIDPTGAESGNSIISTNGDRTFRATIYDADAYFGISNASNPNELEYYPAFWDPAFFNPAYDVSGTSLENPKVIQAYLLEPKITIRNDVVSSAISSISVASSDIPAAAVSITKNASDGSFDIVFNSNYFDKVVFQATSSTGKTYYFALARVTFAHFWGVDALFIPEGVTIKYDVRATYVLSDGTTESFNLEADRDENYGGKGLKMIAYGVPEEYADLIDFSPESENAPTDVYYTVVKTGSTSTTYSGTLAGSGTGTHYSISRGNYELDITK